MKNNFKDARDSCKLSQKYVSVELGVSAPTVSEWESGRKTPTVENLLKLKELYGTTVDYLLGFTNKPFNQSNAAHFTDEEVSLLLAYRRADQRARDMVRVALEPFDTKKASAG